MPLLARGSFVPMIRSKHEIACEIEETREDLAAAAKMAVVGLLLRNPISLVVKTITGFFKRRHARKEQDEFEDRIERRIEKRHQSLYRNLGIALGTGVVAGFAYRYWRQSQA